MKNLLQWIGAFLFIVGLFIFLFAFAMFQGGSVSWFLFFSFLPIFIYQIGLLCYPIKYWQITRSFTRQKVSASDDISVMIHVKRRIPFPVYYCVFEEVIPQSLQTLDIGPKKYTYLNNPSGLSTKRQTKKVIFPLFKRTINIPYVLEDLPRGKHQLSAIRLKTIDIFGFIKKEHTFPIQDHITVYPAKRSVHLTNDKQSIEQGLRSSPSFIQKQTNVISGIREYVSGDRMSWIDWKQTARNQTMMTKEFEQERNTNVLCVLDSCDHQNQLAFEGIVELSLGLMKALQGQVSKMDLLSIGENNRPFSEDENELIYQHLTHIQASKTKDFSKQLLNTPIDMRDYASIIILTTDVNEGLRQSIQKLNRENRQLSLILVQSADHPLSMKQELVKQLTYEGIMICKLTEKDLSNDPLEVKI